MLIYENFSSFFITNFNCIQYFQNFLKMVNREIRNSYTFEDDLRILKILKAIEKSDDVIRIR